MLEHEWPVFLIEVLIEPYARRRMRQYALKRGLAHGKRLAAQTVPVELKKIVERGVMRHEKGSGVNSGRFVWEIEGVNFRVKKSTPKNRADFSSVAQWADIEVRPLANLSISRVWA